MELFVEGHELRVRAADEVAGQAGVKARALGFADLGAGAAALEAADFAQGIIEGVFEGFVGGRLEERAGSGATRSARIFMQRRISASAGTRSVRRIFAISLRASGPAPFWLICMRMRTRKPFSASSASSRPAVIAACSFGVKGVVSMQRSMARVRRGVRRCW